jgi:hypothetical protein
MASTRGSGFEVMMTGAGGALPTERTSNGCVFVMLIAGAGVATGRGKMLMRAVSWFGPPLVEDAAGCSPGTLASMPGGFGNGSSKSLVAGIIFGGKRGTGVRVGSTIRVVSRFSVLGAETVSFFGSVMGGPTRPENRTKAWRLSLFIS